MGSGVLQRRQPESDRTDSEGDSEGNTPEDGGAMVPLESLRVVANHPDSRPSDEPAKPAPQGRRRVSGHCNLHGLAGEWCLPDKQEGSLLHSRHLTEPSACARLFLSSSGPGCFSPSNSKFDDLNGTAIPIRCENRHLPPTSHRKTHVFGERVPATTHKCAIFGIAASHQEVLSGALLDEPAPFDGRGSQFLQHLSYHLDLLGLLAFHTLKPVFEIHLDSCTHWKACGADSTPGGARTAFIDEVAGFAQGVDEVMVEGGQLRLVTAVVMEISDEWLATRIHLSPDAT